MHERPSLESITPFRSESSSHTGQFLFVTQSCLYEATVFGSGRSVGIRASTVPARHSSPSYGDSVEANTAAHLNAL